MTTLRFLLSGFLLATALLSPLCVSAMEEGSGSVFLVATQKFTGSHPDYAPGAYLVKRCVFYEVSQSRQVDKNMAYKTVDNLRRLKDYVVLDKGGNLLNIRYPSFDIAIDDFPNYYAASDLPNGGCGDVLIAGSQRPAAPRKADVDSFVRVMGSKEKDLFLTALQQLPSWVASSKRDDVKKHDLSSSFEKSKKSDLYPFFDGENWFLVRSYFVSMHVAPTQLSVLLFYRTESRNGTLVPTIGYLGTQGGEGTLYLEPAGSFDVDGDQRIDLLVLLHGSEWRGASYLRYQDGRWQ